MQFDNIVLGASFFGCGLACALEGHTLVLESSVVPGGDFSLQFESGTEWDSSLSNSEAVEFKAELLRRNALDGSGRLCIAALAPLLAQWCANHNVAIEYSCDVLQHDGRNVIAIGVDGPKQYSARRIADACPVPGPQKFLTALVTAPSFMPDGCMGPFILRQSIVQGEFHLSFSVPGDSTWSEARAMFHRAWDMRPAALKFSSILLVGTRFSCHNHSNPVFALDAGLSYGRQSHE